MKQNVSKKVDHGNYNVALKLLLKKGDEYLFLTDEKGKYFDFPGGRINADENYALLKNILSREVTEELGKNLVYEVKGPILHYRRHSEEKNIHTFMCLFLASYVSGKIELSSEHTNYQWIDPKNYVFNEKEFYCKEEYLAVKEFFNL